METWLKQVYKHLMVGLIGLTASAAAVALDTQTSSMQRTELLSQRLPVLKDAETRYYSHIHWQRQPGSGVRVNLLPPVNATGKTPYDTRGLKGHAADTEVRTLPNALNILFEELVRSSHFLEPVSQPVDYYLQFHVQRYDSLYALGESDHLLSLGFAHVDRAWSEVFGDNKPAKVSVTLIIYNRNYEAILEVPVTAQLDPCERSANPMPFSPRVNQAFFNAYATTTTGQATIAAINRALEEASKLFAAQPIRGEVLKVDNNEIVVNLGKGIVYPDEELQLMYSGDSGLPAYPISRLAVEKVWQEHALVHALDVFSGQVKAGDEVVLNKVIQQRQWLSVAGEPVKCITPKTKDKFALDNTTSTSEYGFSWNSSNSHN